MNNTLCHSVLSSRSSVEKGPCTFDLLSGPTQPRQAIVTDVRLCAKTW